MTKTKMNFLFPFLLLLLCLVFPSACTEGAKKGLSISLELALPSLFPALVLSGMITASLGKNSGIPIPFFLGLFCGFPVGAKSVCDLYQKGNINKKDSEDLLFFCNNAGPSFLIGFVGNVLFSDIKKGIFLFLLQSVISTICFLIFLRKRSFATEKRTTKNASASPSFFHIFTKSILNAGFSYIYIMSCIIFFSFVTSLVFELVSFSQKTEALIHTLLELTGGSTKLSVFSKKISFPLCALGCGFGGLSVHMQTIGLLEEAGLSSRKHLFGKLFFSFALFAGTLFFQKLL